MSLLHLEHPRVATIANLGNGERSAKPVVPAQQHAPPLLRELPQKLEHRHGVDLWEEEEP